LLCADQGLRSSLTRPGRAINICRKCSQAIDLPLLHAIRHSRRHSMKSSKGLPTKLAGLVLALAGLSVLAGLPNNQLSAASGRIIDGRTRLVSVESTSMDGEMCT